MLSKKNLLTLLLSCTFFISPLYAQTWKVLFYMDSSDDLSDMAFKNITDMMRGKPNDTVEFYIQLHAYDFAGLRYTVTNNNLTFLEEVLITGNAQQDFENAASWAFKNNTIDCNTMIIFSNHGWGALDPRWNAQTQKWEAAEMSSSHNANEGCSLTNNTCSLSNTPKKSRYKGFMFDHVHNTYLTNQALADSLAYVQKNILHEKKIDIVAFDTCMGSMAEVVACVAPYAHYLIGVQSCALRDGFNYQEFMSILNKENCPRDTATEFIQVFDNY